MSLFVAIWYLSLNQFEGLLIVVDSCGFVRLVSIPLSALWDPASLCVSCPVRSCRWLSPLVLLELPLRMPRIEANRTAAGRSSVISWSSLLVLLFSAGFSCRLLMLRLFTVAGQSHCRVLQWSQTYLVSSWRQSFYAGQPPPIDTEQWGPPVDNFRFVCFVN